MIRENKNHNAEKLLKKKLEKLEAFRLRKKAALDKRIKFGILISIISIPSLIYLDFLTGGTGYTFIYIFSLSMWLSSPSKAYKKEYH